MNISVGNIMVAYIGQLQGADGFTVAELLRNTADQWSTNH